MKHLLRVEVEPLPEQRWEKIERALITRLQQEPQRRESPGERNSSSRGLRLMLVAASALAVLIVIAISIPMSRQRPAFDLPSRITTGQSSSHLSLPGLVLDVDPDSAVVVGAETPQGLLLVVDQGSIACQVEPRSSEAPLIVQAGAVRVRVVGTRFRVTRLGESARVQVQQGVVEVTAGGESVRVAEGEVWSSDVPQRSTRGARSVSTAAADEAVAVEKAAPDAEAPTLPRKTQHQSPATHSARALAPSSRSPRSARRDAIETAVDPGETETETAPRQSPQSVFEQATALERSDPGRASRLYRQLESGSDSWARNALYARGRLEASRGNSGEARRLLELYLARFPRGSNAEDARAVLRRLR